MVGGEGVWDWEMVWQLLQELVRSRKEALRCQQSLRDITSKKLEIRKLIGTIRPLRNLLNWHHSSLLSRKAAAHLEFILPGWKKQVFEIINKFLLFFFFFLSSLKANQLLCFHCQISVPASSWHGRKRLCCIILRLNFIKQDEGNNQCISLFCTRNNCTAVKFSLRKTDSGHCSSEYVFARVTAVKFSENKPIQCRNRSQLPRITQFVCAPLYFLLLWKHQLLFHWSVEADFFFFFFDVWAWSCFMQPI